MKRRRGNNLIFIIGIIAAVVVAVSIYLMLPETMEAPLKNLVFFVSMPVVLFVIIALGTKFNKRR